MSQKLYAELRDKQILVAGAGVTGIASARALQSLGAIVELVDDNLDSHPEFTIYKGEALDLAPFDLVMVSPGWREEHPVLKTARTSGLPIINEIDLAWCLKPAGQKWLALTGTNGKTTTVELTAAALREHGFKAIACGNVGTTVIETVTSNENYEFLVLELSSFQLHWMEDAQFVSAAILNIAEDHVDWHGSFDAYATDKLSILDNATTAILNGDDPEIVARTSHWLGRKVFYSLDTPAPGELGVVEELLVDRAFVANPQEAAMICELVQVTPTVPHNVSNTLAAAGLARTAGVSHESLQRAISTFTPGRHRIETVLVHDGVTWIDDSKATNPHAAAASIMSSLSVIWIAGGLAKGASMDGLVDRIKARVRVAILIGEDRDLIAAAIAEHAPHIEAIKIDAPADYVIGGSSNSLMELVVKTAQSKALSGDCVLLAPACASMDQFKSYGDRGDRFAAAVKRLVADGN